MLHVTVLRVSKSFLFQSGGIELDEVAGNVLHLRLHALLHALPCTTANPVQTGWLTLFALVFRHFMQGVDGDIHRVLILVGDLDHLLHHVALWHTHKPSEASHTVVDVHHVVANLKLLYLFECQCHLAPMRLVTLQVIFVEAVKNLVVGEEAQLQRVVNESLMNGFVDGKEMDGIHFCFCLFLKDILQTCNLFLAVGKDANLVALVHQSVKLLIHQLKVLVEKRLRRGVEVYGLLIR